MRSKDMDRFRNLVFEGRAPAAIHPPVIQMARRATVRYGELADAGNAFELCETTRAFLHAVIARAGVDPSMYRPSPLARRLPACLRALKVGDIQSAERLLKRNPDLWHVAIDALLIGVTQFYRDREVFDELRHRWLEPLVTARPRLDVWSVACSDGAELYTMAALLAEKSVLARSRLRGTDCRPAAIDAARRARYQTASAVTLPADLFARFFRHESGAFAPADALRCASIHWSVDDAFSCSDLERWDMILCRNMAIYLSVGMQIKLWTLLRNALRPGGLLIVGKAERPCCDGLRRLSSCIYRRETLT